MTFEPTSEQRMDATGRQFRCTSCHKPFDRHQPGDRYVDCKHCGTRVDLPLQLQPEATPLLRLDEHKEDQKMASPHRYQATSEWTDGDDFQLQPCVERPAAVATSEHAVAEVGPVAERDNRYRSSYMLGVAAPGELPLQTSSPKRESQTYSRSYYGESVEVYPSHRHYPTLESIQRLYKVFGYTTVMMVMPYLLFRLINDIRSSDQGLLYVLMDFTEFALPVILATVVVTGTLFALSEGIQLVIDIQDNTLRLANQNRPKRP